MKRKRQVRAYLSEREQQMLDELCAADESSASEIVRTLIRDEWRRRHPN